MALSTPPERDEDARAARYAVMVIVGTALFLLLALSIVELYAMRLCWFT